MFVFGNYCADKAQSEGHNEDYLLTLEQYFMAFYGNIMTRDRFYHILRFLHFSDNKNEPNKTDENYDRLWKMRAIFDKLNNSYAKYYSPTEHLAADEITVLFRGRVIFKQYIPKKHKWFGTKLYKLCGSKGYTYNMTMYLRKDRKCATPTMTATHATVTGLAARTEHVGHKLYMNNFFSSPALFDDLHTNIINCCGTVRPNRKGMLKKFGHKMKMKRGDLKNKVKSYFTAIIWKDKQNVNILMNMHSPAVEGNFCDKHGKAMKLVIIQEYKRHVM